MSVTKKYLHDRLILLLLSINSFFVIIGSILILLRLDGGSKGIYWVQYRANLGIDAHQAGQLADILAFIVFLIVVFGMNVLLSVKAYQHHRNYSLTVLGLGSLLMFLTIIVSNLLLDLR
jgi:uncharacterized membrane protein YbhN (UPF0104 family)